MLNKDEGTYLLCHKPNQARGKNICLLTCDWNRNMPKIILFCIKAKKKNIPGIG